MMGRIILWPVKVVTGWVLDRLLGPEEEFEFVAETTPPQPDFTT